MKTNEQLMKACQVGCKNLNDANNLLAECYGRIGRLTEENERLRKDAERYRWLSDGGINSLSYDDFGCGPVFDLSRDAIDAARGAK